MNEYKAIKLVVTLVIKDMLGFENVLRFKTSNIKSTSGIRQYFKISCINRSAKNNSMHGHVLQN